MFDYNLIQKLHPKMSQAKPLKSIYYEDFLATNQKPRADNILEGTDKWAHMETIRKDIREFKETNNVDKVIVLWTASTERMCELQDFHRSKEGLLEAIKRSEMEISPSTVFAVATILEGCSYINGSP